MRRVLIAIAATSVVLVGAAFAHAGSAGQLDQSFGRDGIAVSANFEGSANAAAVGAHNGTVVVGGNGAFKITRALPNGHVDRDFGNRGMVTVRFGSDEARPTSVVVTRFGGIIVAGTVCSEPQNCHFGLARLHENGELNPNFGDGGKVEVNFPRRYIRDVSLALGRGGRTVVAGSDADSYRSTQWDIAVAAMRSNGSLDQSFGQGGKTVSSFAPVGDYCSRHDGFIQGMALDSRNRVVVAGECMRDGMSAVARFDRSGELDPSFSGNGLVNRDLGLFNVDALAIDRRDRIDVMGNRGHSCAVARLRTDGGVDRSFGRNGLAKRQWARRSANRGVSLRSVAVDSRGRIVVGGSHSFGFAFARFKPDGHVDRRFGHRGRAVVKAPTKNFHLDLTGGAVLDTRDRIVGAGAERRHHHRGTSHLALVRLLG